MKVNRRKRASTLSGQFVENCSVLLLLGYCLLALSLLPLVILFFDSPDSISGKLVSFAAYMLPVLSLFLFFCITAFAAIGQNCTVLRLYRKRFPHEYTIFLQFLWIPILRNLFLPVLLLRLLTTRMARFSVGAMSASALLAWVLWIRGGGFLGSGAAMLLMMASICIGLGLQEHLCRFKLKRSYRIPGGILLVVSAVSLTIAWSLNQQLLAQSNALMREWGIPVTREALKKYNSLGVEPDEEYTALVRRYNTIAPPTPSGNFIDFLESEAFRQKTRKQFATEEMIDYCAALDRLAAKSGILKYPAEYPARIANLELPQLNMLRSSARYFCWRIIFACEKKDREEAMRLYRLQSAFLETSYHSEWLIGSNLAFVCDAIRIHSISVMLGAQILTDADLRELALSNGKAEEKLRGSAAFTPRAEIAMELDSLDALSLADGSVPWPLNPVFLGTRPAPYDTPLTIWVEWLLRKKRIQLLRIRADWIELMERNEDYYQLRDDLKAATRITEEFEPSATYLMHHQLPAPDQACLKLSRAVARVRMCSLALEIEQYRRSHNGAFPETLPGNVIDPITGQAFEYRVGTFTEERQMIVIRDPAPEEFWGSGETFEPRTLTFTGFRLTSPGENFYLPPEAQSKYAGEAFEVIFTLKPSN